MNGSCKRFLQALKGENRTSRPPVWLMRQAGRYMPEYRKIRERLSFLEMCHRPEVAAEVTLLPIRLLEVDAAILFSDILVIPEALGVGLQFEEGVGPIIERPLKSALDVTALPSIDCRERLGFVGEAITLLKGELKVPLIGFCGAPFTVASYMIEGGMAGAKRWLMRDPDSFQRLLNHLTECTIAYVKLQERAGVEALQIFDSWASALSVADFHRFSLPYMKRIVESTTLPVILFARGPYAPYLASAKPAAVSVDWQSDLKTLRRQFPHLPLQGNLDPDVLYGSIEHISSEVKRLLCCMRGDPGYIFNLGHGIKPDMPFDAVKALVDAVKQSG